MATVSYYAWFLYDYRPRARASEEGHKQSLVPKGTKVSICEEYFKDGVRWLRLHAPAGIPADAMYPEWWVPSSAVTAKLGDVPGPIDSGEITAVPKDVLEAAAIILGWLKS
jgi:hypothetical protein